MNREPIFRLAHKRKFLPSVTYCFLFFFTAILAAFSFTRITSSGGSLPSLGRVVAVYDADTIRVRFSDGSQERVRLIGVDAPELDDPREEVSLRAHLAKRFTFFHLNGKEVTLNYDQTLRDKHGRILAYIWVDGVTLFNEFILREGFASAFFAFPFRKDYQARFRKAQQEAREHGRGLWVEGEPKMIPSSLAAAHVGILASVRFRCLKVRKARSFLYLLAEDDSFEALIPRPFQPHFPPQEIYLGRTLIVTGFLEEFRGRPQILIFFPRQLRFIDLSSALARDDADFEAPTRLAIFYFCKQKIGHHEWSKIRP